MPCGTLRGDSKVGVMSLATDETGSRKISIRNLFVTESPSLRKKKLLNSKDGKKFVPKEWEWGKQGLTQDDLAKKVNIKYSTLTKVEGGIVTKPNLQKIAKSLGVPMEELLK